MIFLISDFLSINDIVDPVRGNIQTRNYKKTQSKLVSTKTIGLE